MMDLKTGELTAPYRVAAFQREAQQDGLVAAADSRCGIRRPLVRVGRSLIAVGDRLERVGRPAAVAVPGTFVPERSGC